MGLTAATHRGITRTARVTRVLVTVALVALALVVAAGAFGGQADPARTTGGGDLRGSWHGVLQSAGLLFFAFAGYARMATLGEEVRDPARTIPRAVVLALGLAVAVYTAVAVTLLSVLGPEGVAASPSPLAAAVDAGSWRWSAPVVRIGASAAALGALLALLAGIARTSLAMARSGDLPRWLGAVHPRHHVPHHAELALALTVWLLVLTTDLREAIGSSSFGVLLYYLVANVSAFTQDAAHRRYPRTLQVVGAAGCVTLAATLPVPSVLAGLAVVSAGVGCRLWRLRHRSTDGH